MVASRSSLRSQLEFQTFKPSKQIYLKTMKFLVYFLFSIRLGKKRKKWIRQIAASQRLRFNLLQTLLDFKWIAEINGCEI